MKLVLTDEQLELQRTLRLLLTKECPSTMVRELQAADSTMEPAALWAALTRVGVFGLPFPAELGGQGSGLFELGLACQEAGRALCPTIVYSTLAFALAVDRLGDPAQQQRWVAPAASGQLRASAALWDPSDASDLRTPLVAARRHGGWYLSGVVDFVQNADVVDALLVSARHQTGAGPTQIVAFVLTPPMEGWRSQRHQTFSRDVQCRVHLDGVVVTDPEHVVGPTGLASDALRWVANAVTALQCLEMVGGAQSVLDQTVQYLKERHQFDRPLASFQAVQHHVADVSIAIDAARLAAYQAAWRVGRGELADREVAIAKLHADNAYKTATLTAHQLWGAMGYMRETDLHLWSERAKTTELLGGPHDTQIARIERSLGLVDETG